MGLKVHGPVEVSIYVRRKVDPKESAVGHVRCHDDTLALHTVLVARAWRRARFQHPPSGLVWARGGPMLRRDRGVTLVEVIVVTALIGLLSGVVFGLTGPIRERARQAACKGQLKQIYNALQLYSADNVGKQVHPAVPLVDPQSSANLLPYLSNHDVLYCPNSPSAMREHFFTTYVWIIGSLQNTEPPALLKQINDSYERYGSKMPIVDCTIHDETYYYPRERDISPIFATAFVIHLGATGSVFSDRVHGHKRDFFSQFHK